MAQGRTNAGSGANDICALIRVEYIEGWTCTCSDGTMILTAAATDGVWLFNVPYAGTWKVTCVSEVGTEMDSTAHLVHEIDVARGQCVNVTATQLVLIGQNPTTETHYTSDVWAYGVFGDFSDGSMLSVNTDALPERIRIRGLTSTNADRGTYVMLQCKIPFNGTRVKKLLMNLSYVTVQNQVVIPAEIRIGLSTVNESTVPTVVPSNSVYEVFSDTSAIEYDLDIDWSIPREEVYLYISFIYAPTNEGLYFETDIDNLSFSFI